MAALHRQGGDRLSALPDKALERVLSHLLSDEAARTVALSSRWRHVWEGVPVVDLVDPKTGERYGCSVGEKKVCFDQQVTSAILCKASATPIRTFRISVLHPPYDLLDQWTMIALSSGVEELDVNLRYWENSDIRLCPFDRSEDASADFCREDMNRYTKTPRQIFRSCSTLHRLRLTNWTLDMPRAGMVVTSLESLCLTRIMDPDRRLQQLISSCPRLAHLTLEQSPSIADISVASVHLKSFAMICCHNARSIMLHTLCLRSLRYKGGLPSKPSFIEAADYAGVRAVTIEICEDLSTKGPRELHPIMALISRCTNLTYLHLSLRPSMAYYSSLFTSVLRCLSCLRHMSLQGCLPTDHAVQSVTALLQNTQNLEVLSLFPLGPEPPKKKPSYGMSDYEEDGEHMSDDEEDRKHMSDDEEDSEQEQAAAEDGRDYSRIPNSLWRTYVKCLDHRMRRINIGNYEGRQLEKMLARFLLSRAAALEELEVTLTAASYPHKDEFTRELRSWRSNHRTRVTCKQVAAEGACTFRI